MLRFAALLIAAASQLIVPAHAESSDAAGSARAIPQPPYYYVLDEAKVLTTDALQGLQTLLIEHDRATGEQFLIAIFESLESEELVQFTNRVFSTWKVGKRGKDNGILLALYWKDRKARIEVGYGLEALLTDAKSKQILEQFLIPELKAGKPDRALQLAAFELLRTIESPLIQSGQAEQILRDGGFRGNWQPRRNFSPVTRHGWIALVILGLGIILVLFVLNLVTAADAHFTSSGWYHPKPWDPALPGRRRLTSDWGGLGGFGGGGRGGFGGFSGDGGLSGGGGASGSW
ncbi:MAG TPA: TPM domain-containing protein [Bdellovibrionota bacterium]|nr:TPM domain-containing protein [Bdellovibrionota bacterium]